MGKRRYSQFQGFTETAVLACGDYTAPESIDRSSQVIQIHNVGNSHWLTSAYLGSGNLLVYDSMGTRSKRLKYDPAFRQQLVTTYRFLLDDDDHLTVEIPDVQDQWENSNNCSFFAIAFAIEILHGRKPENRQFNQRSMRRHLCEIIESDTITPFPGILRSYSGKKHLEILSCHCCHLGLDGTMIECEKCGVWYHMSCLRGRVRSEFRCHNCLLTR